MASVAKWYVLNDDSVPSGPLSTKDIAGRGLVEGFSVICVYRAVDKGGVGEGDAVLV